MTDANAAAAEAGLNSLVLDEGAPNEKPLSDAAFDAPKPEEKAEKPLSNRDALEKALDEVEGKQEVEDKAKAAAADAKAKVEDAERKQDRGEDGKFAKAEKPEDAPVDAKAEKGAADKPATERAAPEEPRQSEGRKYAEPPARFLPEARTKWANVPNEVKAEFHRVSEEFERELSEHKQFRDDLREYEDLAKQHNVTIKDTMARYVAADRALNQNFGAGVAQLAQMYGHNPAQAIAAVIQAHGITPQQYADHVMKNPAAHAAPQSVHQPPQNAQPSPEIAGVKQEIESLKHELAMERAQAQLTPLIQRFATEHPDYAELQDAIATILKDGVIDRIYGTGLSPEQKLAEAYRMAGGSSPSRSAPEPVQQHSEPKNEPSEDAGLKSIRGAPTGGADPAKKRFKSNRDAATAALAELGI